jgi:hypothetical protein
MAVELGSLLNFNLINNYYATGKMATNCGQYKRQF